VTLTSKKATLSAVAGAAVLSAGIALVGSVIDKDETDPPTVTTDNETPVLYDDEEGGNASGDDPAIWVHPGDSRLSIVIATAKEGGLRVYDLDSQELQSLPATEAPRPDAREGRYNNLDIAYGLTLGGGTVDVAVVSDRYNDQLRFFTIDPAGAAAATPLTEVTAPDQEFLFSRDREAVDEAHTAYGLAVYQSHRGESYAVVTQEDATTIGTARIVEIDGELGYTDVETLTMPSTFTLPDGSTWSPCDESGLRPHFEGVAVDQRSGVVYTAQEDVGLWRLRLPLGSDQPSLIDTVTDFGIHKVFEPDAEECVPVDPDAVGFGGDLLTADAEGVDIYYGRGDTGYVLVSSQGDDTFAVYERQGPNKPLGTFHIIGINGVDDIQGCDGIAVTNRPTGDYQQGLLVIHDDPEIGPGVDGDRQPTNFSYVNWSEVAAALNLTIDTTAGNDPRFG